jgi:hypothetical protein
MDSIKEFELYCHFCGIGKKTVRAGSFEEAKRMVEDDEHVCFDQIIRLTKPCWVDQEISKQLGNPTEQIQDEIEYKNWGSE